METQLNQGSVGEDSSFFRFLKTMSMRTKSLIVLVVVLVGAGYYFKGHFIAAKVDGHIISRMAVISQLERRGGKQELDLLINKQLILNEADKMDIMVTDQEIKEDIDKLQAQVAVQGMTLEQLFVNQGISREEFEREITIQKKAEKVLADKIAVSDEEVQKYIKDNKIPLDKDTAKANEQKVQIKDQLRIGKFNTEIMTWLQDARAKAKIKMYKNY